MSSLSCAFQRFTRIHSLLNLRAWALGALLSLTLMVMGDGPAVLAQEPPASGLSGAAPQPSLIPEAPGQPTPGDTAPQGRSRRSVQSDEFEKLFEQTFTKSSGALSGQSEEQLMTYPMPDNAEGFNRAMFAFNDGVMRWVIRPIQAGYKTIFPQPARKSIKRMGHNLGYPVRLVTNLGAGEFVGAASETGRFLVNTTVGVVGLFDPASRIGLPKYDSEFGELYHDYGSSSGTFLTLPILGPSCRRDALAWPPNAVFNPASWLPGVSTFFTINEMTFTMPLYMRLTESERDPYVTVRDLWALKRQSEVLDYEITDTKSEPLPTLGAVFFSVRDPKFPRLGQTRYARVETTGRRLPYTMWLQDNPAPLVYILPGVGSHRISQPALALAEIAYRHGYSVITISSAMNWEFMERAASVGVPGHTPTDARDVYAALTAIDKDIPSSVYRKVRGKALMGMSLGALHTLFISTFEPHRPADNVHFDRYVAINPPVDLLHGLHELDGYYQAPREWPAAERQARIQNTLLKVVKLTEEGGMNPGAKIPLDATESRFLIGLNFRLILRDIIYSSQQRDNQGVIAMDFNTNHRQPIYDEIMKYSFIDYIRAFVLPYYLYHPGFEVPRKEFIRESNLWPLERELAADSRVRVFTNEDDFLLRPQDLDWLRATMGRRLTLFPTGGHLGNLHLPDVHNQIMDAMEDLKG